MQKPEPGSYIDWELVGAAAIALALVAIGLACGYLLAMLVLT